MKFCQLKYLFLLICIGYLTTLVFRLSPRSMIRLNETGGRVGTRGANDQLVRCFGSLLLDNVPTSSHFPDGFLFLDDTIGKEKLAEVGGNCSWLAPFLPAMTRAEAEQVRNLLIAFRTVADHANVTYFMCYGMLLGSFRHGGMIPWDDDLDIQVDVADSAILERALRSLSPAYALIKRSRRWKLFSASESSYIKNHSWRFPFLDIFFYNRSSHSIYDTNFKKVTNSAVIFRWSNGLSGTLNSEHRRIRWNTSASGDTMSGDATQVCTVIGRSRAGRIGPGSIVGHFAGFMRSTRIREYVNDTIFNGDYIYV